MENDVYMTVKELAEYLKLNIQTIYRLAKKKGDGRLPSMYIGGSIRFSKDAVDERLKNNSCKG